MRTTPRTASAKRERLRPKRGNGEIQEIKETQPSCLFLLEESGNIPKGVYARVRDAENRSNSAYESSRLYCTTAPRTSCNQDQDIQCIQNSGAAATRSQHTRAHQSLTSDKALFAYRFTYIPNAVRAIGDKASELNTR